MEQKLIWSYSILRSPFHGHTRPNEILLHRLAIHVEANSGVWIVNIPIVAISRLSHFEILRF